MAPAAISSDIPPSIGMHGGGQQSKDPPDGGGGGIATHNDAKPMVKNRNNKNFVFILF
jgi:hypothetical protein